MKRSLSLLSVIALAAAACGGGDSGVPDNLPSEPDAPVLTVTSEGGFVPVEFLIGNMPRYVLTADRTVYSQGPMIEIFPQPLLPNVQVGKLSEDNWKEVLSLVDKLGMADFDEKIDNDGAEQVADAPTDVFTYYDTNGEHRLAIYALGITTGANSSDRLLALELLELFDEAVASGASDQYTPTRLQIAAGNGGFDLEDGMASVEPWPLEIAYDDMEELFAGWRCTEVSGEAVADLLEIFNEANQATLWDTGSEEVNFKVTPILPGQKACHMDG